MGLLNKLLGRDKPVAVDAEQLARIVANDAPPPGPAPRQTRELTYRDAFVSYGDDYKRRGIVMDYSENGVRLRFPTRETMPDFVYLNAKSVGLSGRARVVWQNGTEAGLALTGE